MYSHILNIIKRNHGWLLETTRPKPLLSEQNCIVKIWGYILEAVFEGSEIKIKWDETVPEYSSEIKRETGEYEQRCIGDKVDLRVVAYKNDKVLDLLNGEFANVDDAKKYFKDHRKLQKETKNIADIIFGSKGLPYKLKKKLTFRFLQIANTEGEIMELTLVDNGLYTTNKLESIQLPSGELDLKNIRDMTMKLAEVRRGVERVSKLYSLVIKHNKKDVNNMNKNRHLARSFFIFL